MIGKYDEIIYGLHLMLLHSMSCIFALLLDIDTSEMMKIGTVVFTDRIWCRGLCRRCIMILRSFSVMYCNVEIFVGDIVIPRSLPILSRSLSMIIALRLHLFLHIHMCHDIIPIIDCIISSKLWLVILNYDL